MSWRRGPVNQSLYSLHPSLPLVAVHRSGGWRQHLDGLAQSPQRHNSNEGSCYTLCSSQPQTGWSSAWAAVTIYYEEKKKKIKKRDPTQTGHLKVRISKMPRAGWDWRQNEKVHVILSNFPCLWFQMEKKQSSKSRNNLSWHSQTKLIHYGPRVQTHFYKSGRQNSHLKVHLVAVLDLELKTDQMKKKSTSWYNLSFDEDHEMWSQAQEVIKWTWGRDCCRADSKFPKLCKIVKILFQQCENEVLK